jgi:hypothetical protein
MAFVITPGELEFEHGLLLSGQSYKVFAATIGSLTIASTLSAWEAAELSSSNGYAAVTGTVSAGSLDNDTGRWQAPVITGQFGPATGSGFQYDAVIIKVGSTRSKPYAVNLLDTPLVLAAGQTRGFQLTLGIKP